MREFDLEFGEGGERAGAGGGGFLINWLCSVVFLFVVLTYMKIED